MMSDLVAICGGVFVRCIDESCSFDCGNRARRDTLTLVDIFVIFHLLCVLECSFLAFGRLGSGIHLAMAATLILYS